MHMHLSSHNWMRVEPIEHTLARLARFGYESIEISGEPGIYGDTASIRTSLREHGVRCLGAVTIMSEGRNLVASDDAQRESSVGYVKSCVTLVKELEGTLVSVVPAQVGKTVPDEDPDTEWKWGVESMKEVCDHAQREGVLIAIEPINRFETCFINRGDQALALAEATGPEVGVCLDAFHINIEENDPFDAIKAAGSKLYDFHVADTNRMPPGMGHYDWSKLVGTLREVGYDGALTVEFSAPIDRTPRNQYPDALATEGEIRQAPPVQLDFIFNHGGNLPSDRFYTWCVQRSAEALAPFVAD